MQSEQCVDSFAREKWGALINDSDMLELDRESDCVIVDLDGTIANCQHRIHHIQKQPKNRDSFYEHKAVFADSLIGPIANLVEMLASQFPVVYVSGRRDVARDATLK